MKAVQVVAMIASAARRGMGLLALAMAGLAPAAEWPIGYLGLADDPRLATPAFPAPAPGAPGGRVLAAVQLAVEDSAFALQAAGFDGGRVVPVEARDAATIGNALEQLAKQGVRHVVLDLPVAGVAAAALAARGKDLVLYNASAPEDVLRGSQCSPQLLHTLPSHAMQSDALAQLLVARKWAKPLVLHGPTPADALLLAAWQRSAKRFGLKAVAEKPFKLSNDPRERDLGNPRLLTSAEREYDVVVVLDAQGEFARDLPYRTVLPRPVVGSDGLVALAWTPWYERNGAPQLSRRFQKKAGRPMAGPDWAAWVAARAAAEAVAAQPKGNASQQAQALRAGAVAVDGYKGQRLTFRAWDGQLRQPLLLAHGGGLADVAPFEGFLHPKSTLDTLGFDAPETACKLP